MGLGPKQMGEAMAKNMKSKTGKTVNEWVEILKNASIDNKKESIQFLKTKHQLGHFQAAHIFENLNNIKKYGNESNLIEQLFKSKGGKQKYEEVASYISSLGEDVRIQPCKTYIPFYKKHQFALLAPKGERELLIGINLPDAELQRKNGQPCKLGSDRINCQYSISLDDALTSEIKQALEIAYTNN